MRVAIPVNENKKNICVSFGRTPGFLIVDTETKEEEYLKNEAVNATGGAGIQAAQFVSDQNVDVLLTPRCGENAAKVLNEGKIKIYKTTTEDVKAEVQKFKEDKLDILTDIHAGFHHGG